MIKKEPITATPLMKLCPALNIKFKPPTLAQNPTKGGNPPILKKAKKTPPLPNNPHPTLANSLLCQNPFFSRDKIKNNLANLYLTK